MAEPTGALSVDWGDGESDPVGETPWQGSHTYGTPGHYVVTLTDDGEPAAEAEFDAGEHIEATALEPSTASIDAEDFEGHVRGVGFTEDTVIVWNGADEPTRFVDDTDVWTLVKPSAVTSPTTLDVSVRNGDGAPLAPLAFVWTEAEGEPE